MAARRHAAPADELGSADAARTGYVASNVAWNVAGIFSFRQWVVPFLSDILGQAADDLEAARQELRVELGREPTRDEVGERMAAKHGFATSPLMPEARKRC